MDKRTLEQQVSKFIKQDVNNYSETEQKRKKFISKYDEETLLSIAIDDFIIGKANNTTFCYTLEYGMTDIGEIRGARSDKYWVYYDNRAKRYKTLKRFSNYSAAFEEMKREIASIIGNAKKSNFNAVENSKVCKTIRRKLAYIYSSNNFLPIYMESELNHFLTCLNLPSSNSFLCQQKTLMDWKNSCGIKKIVELSLLQFSRFIYFLFGKPNKDSERIADDSLQDNLFKNQKTVLHKLPKNYLEKKSAVNIAGRFVYPRNSKISEKAIMDSNFCCQNDASHKSFISKRNGQKYLEVHHLIPLSQYVKFNKSLDIPENIVVLCSECHNCIHYGKDSKIILSKLYENKIKELNSVGINISLKELLKMY